MATLRRPVVLRNFTCIHPSIVIRAGARATHHVSGPAPRRDSANTSWAASSRQPTAVRPGEVPPTCPAIPRGAPSILRQPDGTHATVASAGARCQAWPSPHPQNPGRRQKVIPLTGGATLASAVASYATCTPRCHPSFRRIARFPQGRHERVDHRTARCVGKTRLAIALGHAAVDHRCRNYHTTAADLAARCRTAAVRERWATTTRFVNGPGVLIINSLPHAGSDFILGFLAADYSHGRRPFGRDRRGHRHDRRRLGGRARRAQTRGVRRDDSTPIEPSHTASLREIGALVAEACIEPAVPDAPCLTLGRDTRKCVSVARSAAAGRMHDTPAIGDASPRGARRNCFPTYSDSGDGRHPISREKGLASLRPVGVSSRASGPAR